MTAPQTYRGEALGLPADGRGSLAPVALRVGAFLVDIVASALVAALFVSTSGSGTSFESRLPGSWSLLPFAADYVLGPLLVGRTLGMYLLGLRIARMDADEPVTPLRAAFRTVGLILLVPALVFDRDNRGLHDRWTQTAVVRN